MSTYAHIKRCLDLTDREITTAIEDRRSSKALIDQMVKVSKPGDGGPKLLLLFAKLARERAEWIDGALRVEMMEDGEATVVEVLSELGLGMHERVFPSFKMSVPLDEFSRAVERVPHMIAPLALSGVTSRRLVLTSAADEEPQEAIPASALVAIDDGSLYGPGPRKKPSRDKLAAVKAGAARTASSSKQPAARKASKPAMEAAKGKSPAKSIRPPAAASGKSPSRPPVRIGPVPPTPPQATKIVRPALPRPPALPRTDEHTPMPGPSPVAARSVVAKVPLTRIQVPRSQQNPEGDSSTKPAKRASMKPPKGHSKPPDRRSKSPAPRSGPKSGRSGRESDAPDSGAVDRGWDEPEE
jgi:hypothetical protein